MLNISTQWHKEHTQTGPAPELTRDSMYVCVCPAHLIESIQPELRHRPVHRSHQVQQLSVTR